MKGTLINDIITQCRISRNCFQVGENGLPLMGGQAACSAASNTASTTSRTLLHCVVADVVVAAVTVEMLPLSGGDGHTA